MVGEHPDRLQLGVFEQVRLVDHQDGCPAPFGLLDGQRGGGLRDQGGVMDQGLPAQRGDDLVVDAADSDGGVGEVDDGVPRRVQPGQRGADRDGLPGADLAGDHSDAVFGDAPADPGDGLAVGGVANAINLDNEATLNMNKLYMVKDILDEMGAFIEQVYFPDVCAIAAMYPDWLVYGKGGVAFARDTGNLCQAGQAPAGSGLAPRSTKAALTER